MIIRPFGSINARLDHGTRPKSAFWDWRRLQAGTPESGFFQKLKSCLAGSNPPSSNIV